VNGYTIASKVKWTRKFLARLGREPDLHIARAMGIHVSTARKKRCYLGIPKYRIVKWTPKLIAMLGKVTDTHIAELLGASVTSVGKKRHDLKICKHGELIWTPGMINKLGSRSDRRAGKLLGLSADVVRTKRLKLGIASYGGSKMFPQQSIIRAGGLATGLGGGLQRNIPTKRLGKTARVAIFALEVISHDSDEIPHFPA
jgi:hypothetical protein